MNDIISEWRGEDYVDERMQEHMLMNMITPPPVSTQYDSDPAAWTPALFQKIEDAGLKDAYIALIMWPESFANRLSFQSRMHGQVTAYEEAIERLAFATPPQKATALARAIQEGE